MPSVLNPRANLERGLEVRDLAVCPEKNMLLCQTLAVDGCCVGLNVNLNAALAALLVWNPREQDANAEGVGRRDIDTPNRNMSRVMVVVKVKPRRRGLPRILTNMVTCVNHVVALHNLHSSYRGDQQPAVYHP